MNKLDQKIFEKKGKPQEIERKFLVQKIPGDLEEYPHEELIQGYVAIDEDGREIRLRKKGDKYFKTIKSEGTKIREELETEITKEEFESSWPETEGKRLEKTRYRIPHEKGIIELDIYHGDLEGLLTVEIEFDSEEKSKEFEPPPWFGEEVTEDKRYKNKNLASKGMPKV